MNELNKQLILEACKASKLVEGEKIQDLWSGYGTLKRFSLEGSEIKNIIVKEVKIPDSTTHPRGWDTQLSHLRKLKSYQVESSWYAKWSINCSKGCYVPKCYALDSSKSHNQFLIVLEDLNYIGFESLKTSASISEIKVCLKWLAHFHSTFLNKTPDSLWETGTYWHLDTRPDELNKLSDRDLKDAAKAIDQKLKNTYQTFVHGDAKLANFCFSKDGKKAAAVDFQYVGGGCGMKDVAYFIGSCLYEEDCEKYETELLDYYFQVLSSSISSKHQESDAKQVAQEWRPLFRVAWADFHRFIKGWSPGHWKINSYSEQITRKVLEEL